MIRTADSLKAQAKGGDRVAKVMDDILDEILFPGLKGSKAVNEPSSTTQGYQSHQKVNEWNPHVARWSVRQEINH